MTNSVIAILESQDAPNYILYSLLYFLRVEQPDLDIDINAPIGQIDDCYLVMAAVLIELCLGIETISEASSFSSEQNGYADYLYQQLLFGRNIIRSRHSHSK